MEQLFKICVDILIWMAQQAGVTYEEMNIIVFVIVHPLITVLLFIRNSRLKKQILENEILYLRRRV